MEKLNVAIFDDNERLLEMVHDVISKDKDMEVVGSARNGEEASGVNNKNKRTRCSSIRFNHAQNRWNGSYAKS